MIIPWDVEIDGDTTEEMLRVLGERHRREDSQRQNDSVLWDEFKDRLGRNGEVVIPRLPLPK